MLKTTPRNGLPRPKVNEVKIYFQGVTGSGKTLLSELIGGLLEEAGLKVQPYVFGGEYSNVRMEDQFVDLTRQYVTDVLTIQLDTDDLHKLIDTVNERRNQR